MLSLVRFVWRLVRGILVLIGLGTVVYLWIRGDGVISKAKKIVDDLQKTPTISEGVKDIKAWAEEVVGGIKDEVKREKERGVETKTEDGVDKITDEDRKKLEGIISREVKKDK